MEPTEFDIEIDRLQAEMLLLIEKSAKEECVDEAFDQTYQEITNQIKKLKKKQLKAQREQQLAESYEEREAGLDGYVKKVNYLKQEFDDDLVRSLLESIKVISGDKLEIQFQSGIVLIQRIDYYD